MSGETVKRTTQSTTPLQPGLGFATNVQVTMLLLDERLPRKPLVGSSCGCESHSH
jgi:hypothetical protein